MKTTNFSQPVFRGHFAPSMFSWLDNVLDNSLAKMPENAQIPATNIKETENGFELDMLMPGLKKENIKIEVDKNVLTVSAHKEVNEEKTTEKYTRREFFASDFSRSFTLSESIDVANIQANYTDGVLNLALPRKAVAPKVTQTIPVA